MYNISVRQYLSFLVTFTVYSYIIPWQAALVLMVGIGFHELGHLWAADKIGYKTNGLYLVPFFGGVAMIESNPKSYKDQFFMYIMGPVAGGILALFTMITYFITNKNFFGQAAYWMFFINLFNLLPFSFMDGGMISRCFLFSFNRKFAIYSSAALTVIGGIIVIWFSPIIGMFILFFGGMSSYSEIKQYKYEIDMGFKYFKPLAKKRLYLYIASYVLTAIVLGTGLYLLSEPQLSMNFLFTTQ